MVIHKKLTSELPINFLYVLLNIVEPAAIYRFLYVAREDSIMNRCWDVFRVQK